MSRTKLAQLMVLYWIFFWQLELECCAQAWNDGQLVNPVITDTVEVKDIRTIVHIGGGGCYFQVAALAEFEQAFYRQVKAVVVRQAATVPLV